MPGKIPDRWEAYDPVGTVVEGTRFIPFKVPLEKKITASLSEDQQWTPQMLADKMKDLGQTLAVVIDLTNTRRYYHSDEMKQLGIKYEKVNTEGIVVPSRKVRLRFFSVLDKYLKNEEDKKGLIGIHCTHGVNRTGYLVCRYMIDKMDFVPEKAIEAYNKARGYDIEREHYLADLKKGKSTDEDEAEGDREPSPKEELRKLTVRTTNREGRMYQRPRRYEGSPQDEGPRRRYSDWDDRWDSNNRDNHRGGYDNRDSHRGGYDNRDNHRGGYDNRDSHRGGYESRRGVFRGRRERFESPPRRGGYSNWRGQYESRRGGYDDRRGGGYTDRQSSYDNPRSGYRDRQADGYEARNSYSKRGAGYERADDRRNGYGSRNSGYDSRSGYDTKQSSYGSRQDSNQYYNQNSSSGPYGASGSFYQFGSSYGGAYPASTSSSTYPSSQPSSGYGGYTQYSGGQAQQTAGWGTSSQYHRPY